MNVLHFATHEKIVSDDETCLVNETDLGKFRWVALDLDEETRFQVAAYCISLAERNRLDPIRLPYGFHYHAKEKVFEATGQIVDENFQKGLTCATFVLAILRSLEIELLKISEWDLGIQNPNFLSDMAFQTDLYSFYSKAFGKEEMERLKVQIGLPRFPPHHVAAGAAASSKPLGRRQAERLGAVIVAELNATYSGATLTPVSTSTGNGSQPA